MTLYYSLVFFVFVIELFVFLTLLIPLPLQIRHKVFTFISEHPAMDHIRHWSRISFLFIGILFADSVNRVYRVQLELQNISRDQTGAAAALGAERLEVQARKFYSQRNMYLCGFTLLLSLILDRTSSYIRDIIHLEMRLRKAESKGGEDDSGEVARLKRELALKEKVIDAMKSQSAGLAREYDRLSDEFSKKNTDGTPRKDL
ncbi:receptor-associated protein [Ascosphaera apis ARSEF 7405]|uniref:Endoplasmic reticulum transmembrane protein n=1 Tax=Ascosphaera apis ARSEF 7405 TaxID=392613 RepID=A0A166NXW7_9EURO|nr:receptor-associated protein [Ascosphaera apis ARSEF 7405]